MRILHILKDLKNFGNGVVNACVELACVQSRLGEKVAIASASGYYCGLLADNNVDHFQMVNARILPISIKGCRQFRTIVDNFAPDIVHSHVASGLGLAWLARGRKRYRIISHIHNIHNSRSHLLRIADAAIAVSRADADKMIRSHFPSEKMFVVQNRAIGSLRLLAMRNGEAKALKQPAIVTVAGMNKRKNIDGLIRSFTMIADDCPAAHLYLVGDGQDREEFEKLAARSGVGERIHFEGFHQDPRPYISSACVFVLASHRESFGLVLHEARDLGVPIIASDVDGIPEALDYGKAGLLVPPGNDAALSMALKRMLSDPNEQAYWQQAAKEGCDAQSVFRMGRESLQVYDIVMSKQRPESIVTRVPK